MATAKKTAPAAKAAPKQTAPAKEAASTKAAAPAAAPKKAAAAKKAAEPTPAVAEAPAKAAPAKAAAKPAAAPARPAPAKAVKGPHGHMIRATKEFDQKFLDAQITSLLEERARLTGQALRLEREANSLIEDAEMGDVQFDEEGGEGDTMVVERERDLALSAQNRQIVAEIDAALDRIAEGTYGFSVQSGNPIPKERLKFLPWASLRVDEKVGGIGRR